MYKSIREEKSIKWKRYEIPVCIDRPDRESDVIVVLGHGLYTDMNDSVLNYLSKSLVREGLVIVRFNYPFASGKRKGLPFANKWVPLFKKVIDFASQQSYIPEKHYIFAGGKSFSALVSVRLNVEKEYGKIFLGTPLQLKKCLLTIPVDIKPFLDQPLPMMFIQGGEDNSAPRQKIEMLMGKLNPRGHLLMIPGLNHGLVPTQEEKRSPDDINGEISDIILWFISETLRKSSQRNISGKS